MLRLVNIGNGVPANYEVDVDDTFNPGQMAQLKVVRSKIMCGLSDGSSPIGIIDDINNEKISTVENTKRITVWACSGVFQTDEYDTTQRYVKHDILYCDRYGRFTTMGSSNRPPVAKVTRAPDVEDPTLELMWV
jgi:hypothetical protein